MFYRLLPILLICGCFNAGPDKQIDTASASAQPVAKRKGLTSMFRSDDLGHSWTPIGKGLPEDLQVVSLDTLGKRLVLASLYNGVYLSDPDKQSWQQLDTVTLPSLQITSLHVANGIIYTSLPELGVFASHDLGKSWASLNHDLQGKSVRAMLRVGNELLIGNENGIFVLEDDSKTWRQKFEGKQVTQLLKMGDKLVAGSYDGIMVSNNNGSSWEWVRTGISPDKLAEMEGKIIATYVNNEVVELSEDMGKTWSPIHKEFRSDSHVFDLVQTEKTLISSQSAGIFHSNDWGKNWKDIYHFSFDNAFGVLLSFGEQWNEVYTRPDVPFTKMVVIDGVVFGGTFRGC